MCLHWHPSSFFYLAKVSFQPHNFLLLSPTPQSCFLNVMLTMMIAMLINTHYLTLKCTILFSFFLGDLHDPPCNYTHSLNSLFKCPNLPLIKWQPTPVFLPGKSHGLRSLEGYSPRGPRVGQD